MKTARIVVEKLKKEYGEPKVALNYNTDFQLLVAVILSAQCTDKRVNIVTEKLFNEYKTMEDFVNISQNKLEKLIYSTGFYKNKAKNIKECSRQLIEEFNEKIPNTIKDLTKLAGVGRKTANVIMGHIFEKPAITVDTHVRRLSNRIGFVDMKSPKKIEYYLKDIIQKRDWFILSNLLIHHGRRVCKARSYDCSTCILNKDCKLGRKNVR
ncbi:MAG: endonuclease III [Fusobacteriota bacterium]